MPESRGLCNGNQATIGASTPPSWRKEARLLVDLAIPTVILQLGGVLPNFVCASYVGRGFGPVYLDGFTLANLTGNLFNLSLLQGLYTAADTFAPQAFGAGNLKEVGLVAMRAYLASLMVLIPINIVLFLFFGDMMIWVGEDVGASEVAHTWYRIYAIGLPFYALYMVTWKFLSAQEIMRPLVLVCLVTLCIVLPVAMEGFTTVFGYIGSAVAIVTYQISQAVLLILYLRCKKPYTPGTWPGFLWRDALQWVPFSRFFFLGVGGILASSEWIYWEVISLQIGTLGVVPLSVHTIPTQVLTVGFMFPYGIGVALAVRLGATLPMSAYRAKLLTVGCHLACAALFGIMTIFIYVKRRHIFLIFTDDEDVLEGCNRIWWKVSVFFFNVSIYAINMGVATGLGKQWMFGTVTVIFLLGLSLPGMYYFAILGGGGIDIAWNFIYVPYAAMNVFFLYAFAVEDWDRIRREIRAREGMDGGMGARGDESYGSMNETTMLLQHT